MSVNPYTAVFKQQRYIVLIEPTIFYVNILLEEMK